MNKLPNIDFSDSEFDALLLQAAHSNLGGFESDIVADKKQRRMRKIFADNFGLAPSWIDCIAEIRDNKLSKILWLHNHTIPNDVHILATLSYHREFIGYDMSWDFDDHAVSNSLFTRSDMIEYLKKLREKLDQFHELGIVHGDIKAQNVLINYRTGDVNLCDLDNMQIEDYQIDLHSALVFPFRNVDFLVHEKVDTYMQNLLLLAELDPYCDHTRELIHKLEYGYTPSYLAKSAGPILQKIVNQKPSPNEYLLDHLKKKV